MLYLVIDIVLWEILCCLKVSELCFNMSYACCAYSYPSLWAFNTSMQTAVLILLVFETAARLSCFLQFLSWNMHFCFVYSIAITLRNNIYIKSSFLGWHLFSSSLCIILFVWALLITTELNFMSSQLVLVYCQVNLFDRRRHQWLLNFYATSWKDTIWFSEYQ